MTTHPLLTIALEFETLALPLARSDHNSAVLESMHLYHKGKSFGSRFEL